jgi:hypothetical protein
MSLIVDKPASWASLAAQGLDVVIDPMVVRCGELFLRGKGSHEATAEKAWSCLSNNVHALAMFFDTIVFELKVPIFNYGDTFDAGLNFDARVLEHVNEVEPILHDVTVSWEPYHEVKRAALDELRRLYAGPAKIPKQTAKDILSELVAADYNWSPHLGDLEQELTSEDERRLARFFLGGLIFNAYAQLLDGSRVVQPKRSRLFLAAGLTAAGAGHRFEEELFVELKRRARSSVTELPWRPSVFPYLLSVSDDASSLLAHALQLRGSSEVVEYRHWLRDALKSWQNNGTLAPVAGDIRAISAAIDRKLGTVSSAPKVELKITVADVAATAAGIPKPPGAVDLTPTLSALWGWFFSRLPGKRYRQLLTRAVVADHQYAVIENRLSTVWKGQG